jgi:hypothetical protein
VRAGQPPVLRYAAAVGLSHSAGSEAAAALEQLTSPVENRGLRTYGLNLLPQQGDTARAVALATRYLDDPDPLYAQAAVSLLGRVGGAAGRARLQARLAAETRVLVRAAIERVLNPR